MSLFLGRELSKSELRIWLEVGTCSKVPVGSVQVNKCQNPVNGVFFNKPFKKWSF